MIPWPVNMLLKNRKFDQNLAKLLEISITLLKKKCPRTVPDLRNVNVVKIKFFVFDFTETIAD